MIRHPTAAELTTAVAAFDEETAAPGDARHAFLARVADNARAILSARPATASGSRPRRGRGSKACWRRRAISPR